MKDEISKEVKELVDERFYKHKKLLEDALKSDLLPLKLAAIKYHISESYLYKLRYQQHLKFYKLGSMSYVKDSELVSLFSELAPSEVGQQKEDPKPDLRTEQSERSDNKNVSETDYISPLRARREFGFSAPFFIQLKRDGLKVYKLRRKRYVRRSEIEAMMTKV